jgi:hypothetical protein
MFMTSLWDIFPTAEKTASSMQTPRGYNNQLDPNAGNFQEYTYEMEWMEAHWHHVYKMVDLVTAYWYPWIDRSALHKTYPELN